MLASFKQRLPGVPAGRRTKWLVVVGWLLLTVALAPLAGEVSEVEENDPASFLPRGSESTQVTELQPRFDKDEHGAVVVYVRGGGLTAADRAAVEQDRTQIAARPDVGTVAAPEASKDGAALLLTVPFRFADDDDITGAVEDLRELVAAGLPTGLEAKATGADPSAVDMYSVFDGLDSTLLFASAGVVILMLLLTYRSPVLWLLPLVGAAMASQLAGGVVYLLAKHAGLAVNGQSGGILPILVFGAGTDYALLLIARYREELHLHQDRHVAMAAALRRSGPAVFASAGTVAAGLLCLTVADLNSTRGLGPVGAIGVICAVLIMTTLLPALLVICGRWVFWPAVPRLGQTLSVERSGWSRVGEVIARRPRAVWVGTSLALCALAAGALLAGPALSGEQQFRTGADSIEGQRLLAAHYPAGAAEPALVVAAAEREREIGAAARSTPGVADVLPAVRSGDLVQIPVVLTSEPLSTEAERTVGLLREAVHAVPDGDALVGGPAAEAFDTDTASSRDRRVVIPVVLAAVLAILVLVLRSLVAPVLLIATVVLSFFAALGTSVLLFEPILGFRNLDPTLILLGFVFLVALGVDYNIFLMTRVREEVARHGHRTGVLRGLAVTGGVITSAGLVLAATFAVPSVLPLTGFAQMGVLIAVGVLLDTLIVRSVLVPALTLDLGRRVWAPSRLASAPSAPKDIVPESVPVVTR